MSLRRSIRNFSAVAFSVLVLAVHSSAQVTKIDDTTSAPIPGAGHDYIHLLNETVNPANGSVSIHIDVPMPKGRGLSVPFAFAYNSNGTVHLEAGGPANPGNAWWASNKDWFASGGWSYVYPNLRFDTWTDHDYEISGYNGSGPIYTDYQCMEASHYLFTDSAGGMHQLGMGKQSSGNPPPAGCPSGASAAGGDPQAFGIYTSGSSAIFGLPAKVTDKTGATYYFNTMTGFPGGGPTWAGPPNYIEDRNGNKVTVAQNGSTSLTFTDTFGRSILSVNGFGINGATTSVAAGGLTYQVTWKTISGTAYNAPTVAIENVNNSCVLSGILFGGTVISQISLPNGKSFHFYYGSDNPNPSFQNPYGLLSEIDYPDGGAVRYTWKLSDNMNQRAVWPGTTYDGGGNPHPVTNGCIYQYTTPVLATRQVFYDANASPAETQNFVYHTNWDSGRINWTTKTTQETTTDNARGLSASKLYTYSFFYDPVMPFDNNGPNPTQSPVEQSISYYDWGNTTTPKQTVTKNWYNPYELASEQTTLLDVTPNLSSQTVYFYGVDSASSLDQITEVDQYDFGATSPTKKTLSTFQVFIGAPGALATFPCKVLVQDSNSATFSETDYFYDGGTTLCGASGSAATSSVANLPAGTHDETVFAPNSATPRGNTTKVTRKCFPACTSDSTTTFTYDETGQVVTSTDPCGNATCADTAVGSHTTQYFYTDNYDANPSSQTNAYLTKIIDPLGHVSQFKYAYSDGQLISSTDQNGLVTSYLYADSLRRLTETDLPDGGKTTIAYNDTAPTPSVTTTKTINATQSMSAVTKRDGIGHVVQTKLCEDGTVSCTQPIYTDTTYDGSGNVWKQSNPYRSGTDPSSSPGTTTFAYDALGRKLSTTYPDSSVQLTSYAGAVTSATDPTGRLRRSLNDGLGRLVEVDEPGAAATTGAPGSGSTTLSGSERSVAKSATAGAGTVSISGSERDNTFDPCAQSQHGSCPQQIPDAGTVSVTVNGLTASAQYGFGDTSSTVASKLASAVSSSSLPVTATVSGAVVTLTSKTTGSTTNYTLSSTCATTQTSFYSGCSFSGSASGSTLTGGANATTVFDTGTISVTINGVVASTTYGQTDTSATMASKLATAVNASSAPATAVVNGSVVNLAARSDGAATNYSLSVSSVSTNSNFTGTSFPISPSGATLTGGSDATFGTTPLVTLYTYDVLGNLSCAVQKGADTTAFSTCAAAPATWRPRSFTYDSLSRLLTSSNPEVGTITYTYDANNNVSSKKDNRNITATYGYDVLNRLKTTTYSNGDPAIAINYDEANCLTLAACQNIGQRTSMTDAAGSEAWSYQVDATNKQSIHANRRVTGGISKDSKYVVNLAGGLTQVVYPTGRTVNYTYDNAGRPATAADSANGITYATASATPPTGCPTTAVCYTPQGSVYGMAIGKTSSFTGVNFSETFNNRLQPLEIKASSSGGNAIDITYNFFDSVSRGNAGHVYGITNNIDAARSQTFTYDQLNRIVSAQTTSTFATAPTKCWGETYAVDAWANLTAISATSNTAYTGCVQESGFTKTADNFNHLFGFGYDTAGNTSSDGTIGYSWDGESQLKSATNGGVTTNYLYDGQGRRASKSNGKLYWYGSGGEILAETNATGALTAEYIFFGGKRVAMIPYSGTPPVAGTAQFYLEDLLGTSRVVTSNTGVPCYDADFYPYGGERTYTNTCTQNAYKFEGKERDTETGNDEFGARYYSNRFGRWLSADWSNVPAPIPYANLTNPQTLNLYAMVADDPESFADLDGHCCWDWIPTAVNILTTVGDSFRNFDKNYNNDPIFRREIQNATYMAASAGTAMVLELQLSNGSSGTRNASSTTAETETSAAEVQTARSTAQGESEGAEEVEAAETPMAPKQGSSGGPTAGKRATPAQRQQTLQENNGQCVFCGEKATQADHSIPRSRNGNNTQENLQPTCARCNNQKNNKTTPEYLEWKQQQAQNPPKPPKPPRKPNDPQ